MKDLDFPEIPPRVSMTLRDEFASRALIGLLADGTNHWTKWPDQPVTQAYLIADAMLTIRALPPERPEDKR